MALNTKQVGTATASSVAAATVRVGSGGGRNVASTSRPDVERIDYAHQPGLGDETLLRYQNDDGDVSSDGRRQRDRRNGGTALLWQTALGRSFLSPPSTGEDSGTTTPSGLFLDHILRGINSYERSIRLTSPTTVRPGSVMNFLY